MLPEIKAWGEALLPWAGTAKAGLTALLTYLVYSIKSNHLPHIYDRLGTLSDKLSELKGQMSMLTSSEED